MPHFYRFRGGATSPPCEAPPRGPREEQDERVSEGCGEHVDARAEFSQRITCGVHVTMLVMRPAAETERGVEVNGHTLRQWRFSAALALAPP
jgi:hypothetical protein